MSNYDLYGSLMKDINEGKKILEKILQIKFEPHESSYQGGEYFRYGEIGEENFLLKRNIDLLDNEPAELLFQDYPILFYVNNTLRSADLQRLMTQKIEGFVLLKKEEF